MTQETSLVSFPTHALLVLEERLKDHQADGTLDAAADVTEMAVKILLLALWPGIRAPG